MEKYNEYKDSGIEWLGLLPSDWESIRIDWCSEMVRGNTALKKDELLPEGDYIALQYGKTYKVDEVDNKFQFYVNKELYKKGQLVNFGDTILISTSETLEDLGHSCFYNRIDLGLLGGEQILLKPKSKIIIEKYLFFYSKFFCLELRKYATGLKVFRFNIDDLKNIFIPIPPLKEQTQIANYLDAKTTLIDKKIKLLKQKIKHYKAYRKTLINETVTKGLDRTVKLKDSGIDWIGEIPEHWEVKRLKDYFNLSKGVNSSKYNNDYVKDEANLGEYPVYSGQTENNGLMAMINSFEYNFNKKVMLVTTVGAKAMDLKIVQNKFTLSQNCALFISKKGIDTDFQYFYLTQLFREERKVIPTIMQPSLRIEDLKKYFILLPPIKEQQQIADYLDSKTTTIDKIVNNIETQIKILKELRKTLINEVVTGKVKVTL